MHDQGHQFEPNYKVLDAYISYLENGDFDAKHARRWAYRYRDNPEAAMCEASVWAVLTDCGVSVAPNPSDDGPDLVCLKRGIKFYVEATCIEIERASRETGLNPVFDPNSGPRFLQSLNQAIFFECRDKTVQCANLNAPCLLAIGTFHAQASIHAIDESFVEWLLTDPSIGADFDPASGACVGSPYQMSRLRKSLFSRFAKNGDIEYARQPISGVLIAGFGCEPARVYGVLNPHPLHPFDPGILNRIRFCAQRIDFSRGVISTEWNIPSNSEN